MKFSILLFFILFSAFYFLSSSVSAQEIDPNAVAKRQEQLEEELSRLESQIEADSKTLEGLQKGRTTLERDIAVLNAQIDKARLEIKARDLRISGLVDEINDRSQLVDSLLKKLDEEKAGLSELLRRIDETDTTPLVEVVLGYEKLSDFFADSDNFESIQKAIQTSLGEILETKNITEQEKEDLQNKKSEEMELRSLQALEKKREEEAKANKNILLKSTKGKEQEYQKILAGQQKDAATIRSQLFMLRGSPAIPFAKALEYADKASKATGVRPAFLLAIIAEESNLGANVGTGNWKYELADYHCAGQRQAFIDLTASLGFDPDLMPVSKRVWYGYCGGAMGPAQFMPITWKGYSSQVSQITGHNPANPWEPFDAFASAALYLRDLGAADGGYTAERNAALKYLAGSKWKKSAYAFYGDDVMALAQKYQEQINILTAN